MTDSFCGVGATIRSELDLHISICISTYHRPAGLQRLLGSLNALRVDSVETTVDVIVVDNDVNQSAREACNVAAAACSLPVHYAVEPRRGIPFARNKAVEHALGGADFLAFVDDDETVDPEWLAKLLDVQRQHDADVVTGPTIRRLPPDIPSWIVRSRAFHAPRRPTGTGMPEASTNNVLVKREVFERVSPHFNERMALTGGTDAHFFRRVHQAGFSILWVDDALTYEWFPRSRVTARWIIQRSFRLGNCWAIIDMDFSRSIATRVRLLGKALALFAKGAILAMASAIYGSRAIVRGVQCVSQSVGILAGLGGKSYEEYRRVYGS